MSDAHAHFLRIWLEGARNQRAASVIAEIVRPDSIGHGLRKDGASRLIVSVLVALACSSGLTYAQPVADIRTTIVPGHGVNVGQLAAGPDDAIWFTVSRCDDAACTSLIRHEAIGRLASDGSIVEYALPPTTQELGYGLYGLAAGPDGALWFTEIRNHTIGRITIDGAINRFALPPDAIPYDIVSGPDGALWFTDRAGAIGRITTAGEAVRHPVGFPFTNPVSLVAGPDGAMWFTRGDSNEVDRITAAGAITRFPQPSACAPRGITVGPDGALWFACPASDAVGRMTVAGIAAQFQLPGAGNHPVLIAAGPDGALWVTEQNSLLMGRVTVDGLVTQHPSGPGDAYLFGLAARSDGIWFAKADHISHIPLGGGGNLRARTLRVRTPVPTGGTVVVENTTSNDSWDAVPASHTGFWLSRDKKLGGDVLAGERPVPPLPPGGVSRAKTSVAVPDTAGTYYLIGEADSDDEVAESNELDNHVVRRLLVGPDLAATLAVSPSSPSSTAPTTLLATVRNVGAEAAGPTTTEFYRSADGTLGPGAVLLQSIATPLIAPDATVAVEYTLMLPPGTYYLIVRVDAEGAVGEVTEKNNVRKVRKTVP